MAISARGWSRKLGVLVGLVALAAVMGLMLRPGAAADTRPGPGQVAPDFRLTTVDGVEVRLSDLRGRPVVVNFWATWCMPCRTEMPLLAKVHEEDRDEGLVVVGVNLQESRVAVVEFGHRYNLSFPLLLDADLAVTRRYGVVPLPTTLFIDRDGVIQSRFEGQLNAALLADRLRPILAAPGK